jgi:hypothetical protein
MAKPKPSAQSLPGLEDPRITGLPEEMKGLADALLQAAEGSDEEQEEALRKFVEGVFNDPKIVSIGAAFLAEVYEGREGWLAKRIGTPELVQEMAAGQALLTCVAAGEWVARRDFTRLLRLGDGMLAARLHLRGPDCLDLMSAMASTLALIKQQKALALVSHVEDCQREGVVIDQGLLAEARHRLQLADVVGAANQTTREMWDQRLLNPNKEWTWDSPKERQALLELAEWLTPGHPASGDFAKVVPGAWWDLLQARVLSQSAEEAPLAPLSPASDGASAWTGGMLVPEPPGETGEATEDAKDVQLQVRLGWFVAGGVFGALVVVLLHAFSGGTPKSDVPSAIPVTAAYLEAAGKGNSKGNAAAIQWCEEERVRLTEELVHVGRLGTVKAAAWTENVNFLTGRTPDLPSQSQMYRKMLVLLHLDPPQDKETRTMVPRLLLRRSADEELVALWERCLEAGVPLQEEIAAGAKEALEQPSLSWTAEQRQRLEKLSKAKG